MDIGERIIGATVLGKLDRDIADKLLDIHLRVIRSITCPVTGAILDSRKSHLLTVEDESGERSMVVVHESADSDVIADRLATIGATVVDRFDPADAWRSVK